jgi:RimJ/RimL family protein N-acetyltransferase
MPTGSADRPAERVLSLAEIWPVFGLQVEAGPLQLRAVRDEDIPGLVELARSGIHAPDEMPFSEPWSTAPAEELATTMAAHYWRVRSQFGVAEWSLEMVARWDGEVVGCQGFHTTNYLVTRSGETGSWLGRRFQGRGIGTLLRQAMCCVAVDHLDAAEVVSAAYLDNPASLSVSRKLGYRPNGQRREQRREAEMAISQKLVLAPQDLLRPEVEVRVSGVDPFRRFVGLVAGPSPTS